MSNFVHSCNRLLLIKVCLCCFLDMHFYSNNLSIIAKVSLLNKLELFPAGFSCTDNFNLSQSSSRSNGTIFVFEIPVAMIKGEMSNFIKDLSL